MIKRLEEDSANVLAYMVSNGLVANATKTSLVILNTDKKNRDESKTTPIQIKIGNTIITQEKSAKLLGIQFNDRQMCFLSFYAIRHKSSNLYPTYLKGYEAT